MSAFLALLVGLALSPQCAGPWRSLADQLTDRTVHAPPFSNELRVRDAAPVGDREWIEVTDSAVIRWLDGSEQSLLELPEPRFGWKRGDLRVAADGSWSYAAASFDEPNHVDVALLASAGPVPRLTRLSVPVTGVPLVWSSLGVAEPSALLVCAGEGSTLDVERITRAGAQRVATIDAPNFYPPGAAVCPLPDGRIVLAALGEDPRVARTIVLHVISAAGDDSVRLPAAGAYPLRELFVASSPAGQLCVVARSERGELIAAVVDVAHPAGAEFRVITAPADRAVFPSIVHAEDRFVVAWLSTSERAVIVRELRDDRILLPHVMVAADSQLDNPLLALRSAEQGVSILARTRIGLTLSHVRTPVAGRAAASAYVRARCDAKP